MAVPQQSASRPVGGALGWTWFGLAVLILGMGYLLDYAYRPGRSIPADRAFAELTARGQSRLLLFYHPQCPCTVATVEGFVQLLGSLDPAVGVTAYAYLPSQFSEDWIESTSTRMLREVPGLEIQRDPNGELAKQHGVMTSGHVVFVNADGQVEFQGGITSARSHFGPALPRQALRQVLSGEEPTASQWPTFGCPLISLPGS